MVALAAFVAVATAQTPPSSHLTPARFVAEKATEVTWNPEEKFVGFLHKEGDHVDSIGLYDLNREIAKTLFKPTADQQVDDVVWLAGRPVELVATTEPAPGREKPSIIRTVWALDGTDMTLRKLWSREFTKDEDTNLSFEVSPSLAHALVTLSAKSGTTYFVVTLGAAGMVFSQDVTQATKQGQNFSGWSIDGTALFGPYASQLPGTYTLDAGSGNTLTLKGSGGDSTARIVFVNSNQTAGDQGFVSQMVLSIDKLMMKPNIEPGASVYELMPTNGSLRPIRFHGAWPDENVPPSKVNIVPTDEKLKFKNSIDGTKSLWLAANVKDPQEGDLVSPQADEAWLAPRGGSVAFIMNGVLFVRKVKS